MAYIHELASCLIWLGFLLGKETDYNKALSPKLHPVTLKLNYTNDTITNTKQKA